MLLRSLDVNARCSTTRCTVEMRKISAKGNKVGGEGVHLELERQS